MLKEKNYFYLLYFFAYINELKNANLQLLFPSVHLCSSFNFPYTFYADVYKLRARAIRTVTSMRDIIVPYALMNGYVSLYNVQDFMKMVINDQPN